MRNRGWEPDRFKKTLVRAFKFFHPAPEKNKQHLELIAQIEASQDIIETLCTLDPNLTIPPYEDQNNRRPPVDQTLFLSPDKLTANFGEIWKSWATNLIGRQPELEPFAEILERATDRKSRVTLNGHEPHPTQIYQLTYALQRAFDRSKALDPYALRALAFGSKSSKLASARTALERCIGSQNVEAFLDCARRYYREVEDAKVGLWFDNADGLLERSNLHPPMKKKILPLLVANILQADEATGLKFLNEVWRKPIKGRETASSRCARIEAVRKNLGGDFKSAYQEAQQKKEQKLPLTAQDKDLLKIRGLVEETAKFIASNLALSEVQEKRFANPYSMTQFYTLIETEVSGFSATTLAAHLENAWRMTSGIPQNSDDKTARCAQCSRLPAETARPFDGLVRRLIDRQAWEIAKRVAADVRRNVDFKNGSIDVSLFIEENKFEFAASVADLKKIKRTKDKMQAEAEHLEARWESKNQRIKAASRGLCPYSGKHLGDSGEIDHIIPRNLTKSKYGTIFNSEANLIYVSHKGNQQKADQLYYLSANQLAANYLQEKFGTSDVDKVAAEIEAVVGRLIATKRLKFFDLLDTHEQDCVRHALFLDNGSEAREAVLELLATQRRTRVNGTQIWMIKCLAAKLSQELSDWCRESGNQLHFRAAATDVGTASDLRKEINKLDNAFTKKVEVSPDAAPVAEEVPEQNKPKAAKAKVYQPVASHSMDAVCAFAVGMSERNKDDNSIDYLDPKVAYGLHPKSCEIIRLQAKPQEEKPNFAGIPIFKEGIYSEQFLPVFTLDGKVWVGYETLNENRGRCGAIQISGKRPEDFLTLLAPFLDKPVGDLTTHTTYRILKKPAFELLAKAALQPLSELELRQARALDSIRFCTSRKSLLSVFMAANGKSLKKRDEVLDPKLFLVKVELKGEKTFKLNGTLSLPVKAEWIRICDSEEFVDALGKPCTADELRNKLKLVWKRPTQRSLAHAPARREFSLPAVDKPSGGFRIRRMNLFGEKLYQVHAINAKKFRGFASDGHKLDWSSGVLFEQLQHENLTECGGRFTDAANVASMAAWRRVLHQENLTVWIAPGTEGRRYVRIEAPFDDARKWFEQSVEDWYTAYPQWLPASFKIDKPAAFQAAMGSDLADLVGQPRSEIFVERIGSDEPLRFWYIATSGTKRMNESYNQSLDVCDM